MAKHGKKYLAAAKLVDAERRYEIGEAAELLPQLSTSAFDGTVEAHLRLGVDPRHADQLVRGTVVLPHGTGRTTRVIVFAQGEKAQEALRAGADEVGADDLVKKIDDGWFEFDVAVATPDMMGTVGRLGKKLGPRGLMPNPKSGTVTFDIERAVGEVKSGRVEFKVDRAGIVHVPVGRASFTPDQLVANVATLVDAVNRAKPSGAKGTYMRTLTLAPTMGPGVRIDIPSALAACEQGGIGARYRPQLEVHLADDAERAEATHLQAREVVTRDVLHDTPAGPHHTPVAGDDGAAKDVVARLPVAQAQGTGCRRREHRPDGAIGPTGRIERQPEFMLGEPAAEDIHADAALHGGREVGGAHFG